MKTTRAKHRIAGGVHPQYHKDLTADKAIEEMRLPDLLRVSMSQHMGAPAKPVVKKGDMVLRGQMIGEAAGFISVPVHSPTSGTVKAVGQAATPTGTNAMAIDIEPDRQDRWMPEMRPRNDSNQLDTKQLVSMIAEAGVAGMGGAGFPTHVKLSPPPGKPIDTVIINGAESEPYLTADYRLMLEHSDRITAGCLIIARILGARTVRIAVGENKPQAIATMEKAIAHLSGDFGIAILRTQYPQGAEKQQIYAITGREVPSGRLPMDVGAVVENVGTTAAVWDAIVNGRPLTKRITTVSGTPVNRPANVHARIGTFYSDLIDFCGGTSGQVAKVISGGPMMGLAQHSLDTTTTKTTSGLVLLPAQCISEYTSMPCIGCGRCIEACPMNLAASELSQMLEAEDYEAAEQQNVMDCMECGCCAFECPAHRPLVQHMRQGKAWVMEQKRKKNNGS